MSAAAGAGDAQYRKMTQTPIPRLVATLAVPTIISMLVTAVYNMADTFFVAQLGTSAAGAVGIVFSLMAVIQAIGFMLGMGAGNLVSRYLGAKEQRQADCAASTAFFTALAFGLGITVLGTLFLDPLMRVLGATPTILPYARDYARYILFGAPVMCASFVLNNILRGEGKAMLAMVGIGLGGVLNIGLDPLFIYAFGLGIAGAAIATLLSQCVSFAILLACFLRRKSAVRLHIGQVSRKAEVYARIIKTGMPSFCRQSLASVATVLLNVNAAVYGDAAVAAMSVVGRIFMFVFSFMLGFGQGFQPVAGYNFGAKRYDRVRGATYFTMLVGTVLMSVLAAAGFLAAAGRVGAVPPGRRGGHRHRRAGAAGAVRGSAAVRRFYGDEHAAAGDGAVRAGDVPVAVPPGHFLCAVHSAAAAAHRAFGRAARPARGRPVYFRGDASVFAFIPAAAEAVGTGGTCCGGKIRIWKSRGDSPRLCSFLLLQFPRFFRQTHFDGFHF